MTEPKPFASLSATLLARKGQAKPAMRPQSFHMVPGPAPQVLNGFSPEHDDLGWNDMGHDEPVDSHGLNGHANGMHVEFAPVPIREDQPVSEPAAPPAVVEQHEVLAREFELPAPPPPELVLPVEVALPVEKKIARPRAAPGSKAKAAFTLRLDAERHLRLRLVCAVNHRSAQQIVTIALDEYLARQPGNAALAAGTSGGN